MCFFLLFLKHELVLKGFTPKAAAVFVATGVGLYFYFRHEKEKIQEAKRTYYSIFTTVCCLTDNKIR